MKVCCSRARRNCLKTWPGLRGVSNLTQVSGFNASSCKFISAAHIELRAAGIIGWEIDCFLAQWGAKTALRHGPKPYCFRVSERWSQHDRYQRGLCLRWLWRLYGGNRRIGARRRATSISDFKFLYRANGESSWETIVNGRTFAIKERSSYRTKLYGRFSWLPMWILYTGLCDVFVLLSKE